MILGFDLSLERMKQIFTNLNMKAVAHQHKEELKVIPPPYRFDIEIEEDLIEEVARIEGFDSIPEHIPVGLLTPKIISSEKKRIDFLRDTLVHDDFNEVITFSFIEEDSAKKFMSPFILNESEVIKVVNPISSSMESMRTSLIPGLLKVLVDNVRNQQDRVRIFEIGRVFFKTVQDLNSQEVSGITQCHLFSGLIFGTSYPEQWSTQKRIVDYFDMKNILYNALREKFIVKTAPKNVNFFHPKKFTLITQLPEKKASKLKGNVAELDVFGAGNVGYFGELHPEITKSLNLSTSPILFEIQLGNLCQEEPAKLQKISKVPIVRRDMSFVLNSDIQIGELSLQISKLVKSSRLGRLLMDFSVCDVYKGADLPK